MKIVLTSTKDQEMTLFSKQSTLDMIERSSLWLAYWQTKHSSVDLFDWGMGLKIKAKNTCHLTLSLHGSIWSKRQDVFEFNSFQKFIIDVWKLYYSCVKWWRIETLLVHYYEISILTIITGFVRATINFTALSYLMIWLVPSSTIHANQFVQVSNSQALVDACMDWVEEKFLD